MQLDVVRWAAWGAGLSSHDDWRNWTRSQPTVNGEAVPELGFISPLQRRRLSRLSRLALDVAHRCLDGLDISPALVFCTRYGEYGRTHELLCALAAGEPLSPASFSVSVHNTAAGLCAIAEKQFGHAVALSAGANTLEQAFLDCWALLQTGETENVLLVFHDEPLPEAYPSTASSVPGGLALAVLLTLPNGGDQLSLSWRSAEPGRAHALSHIDRAISLIRLLGGEERSFAVMQGRLEWTWCVHGAH